MNPPGDNPTGGDPFRRRNPPGEGGQFPRDGQKKRLLGNIGAEMSAWPFPAGKKSHPGRGNPSRKGNPPGEEGQFPRDGQKKRLLENIGVEMSAWPFPAGESGRPKSFLYGIRKSREELFPFPQRKRSLIHIVYVFRIETVHRFIRFRIACYT